MPLDHHSRNPREAIEEPLACPLLEGRNEAWLRCCTGRFLPLARRLTRDDPAARDALQESWIAVLNGVQQYRGESPACAWVGAIVRNEALRQGARQRRSVPLDDQVCRSALLAADGPSPEDDEHTRQLLRILQEILTRLPPTYREIIRLRDLEERSPDEVAVRLRISRSSVSSRLHRARALLRRRLLRRLNLDDVSAR